MSKTFGFANISLIHIKTFWIYKQKSLICIDTSFTEAYSVWIAEYHLIPLYTRKGGHLYSWHLQNSATHTKIKSATGKQYIFLILGWNVPLNMLNLCILPHINVLPLSFGLYDITVTWGTKFVWGMFETGWQWKSKRSKSERKEDENWPKEQ